MDLLSYSKFDSAGPGSSETQLTEACNAISTIVAHRLPEQALRCHLWPSVSDQVVLSSIILKKPFPCMHCERSYKNKSSLNRHVQYDCGKN